MPFPKKSVQRRLNFERETERVDSPTKNNLDERQRVWPEIGLTEELPQSSNYSSPAVKKQQVATVVTPDEEEGVKEDLSHHVPKYLHKNVEYSRQGEATLPTVTVKVFQWITKRFDIPKDFEQRGEYGPLSGSTYEERVLKEYSLGKLSLKGDRPDEETKICIECGTIGHIRNTCPSLI